MRRAWFLACWSFVGASVAVACGGSSDTGLFGSSGDTNASSSGTTSSGAAASSSGTTSSGGSSGTTSSGGSSGTTSSGGSSGGTVVDAGVDAGKSCRRAMEDCAANEYCKVTNCADKGICTIKPNVNTATGDIVCGCDGITYYSPELAASFGVSVNPQFANECTGAAARACGGASPACPQGRYCNYGTEADPNTGFCSVTVSGTCWGVPNTCPTLNNPSGSSLVAMDCATDACSTFCQAIKAQKPWHVTTYNKCN